MPAQLPTPGESSRADANQNLSIIGVQGTLGTSDAGGTARTVAFSGDPATGAQYVIDLSGGAGTSNIQGSVQVTGGSIAVTSGTILNTGTNVNVITGTQQLLTTLSNLTNGSVNVLSGTILNTGTNINMVTGTQQLVTTVSNLTNGSVNILTGTLQSSGTTTGVGVVSNLTNGSVNVLTGTIQALTTVTTVSNLTNGSVRITVGTVGGAAASAAAAAGNPNLIAGTDAGGTVYSFLTDTAGHQKVDIVTGTIQSSGTTTGVGVVSNLTNGSVNILTGTLQSAGTTTGVGVVSNLTNGSVNILTGTIQNSGNGTIVGGTLGNLNSGTITSVAEVVKGTTTLVSTVTTVSNLTNGSINMLTGTQQLLGTMQLGTTRFDPTTIPTMLQQGTLGTAGGSFFGTLSAASGAGTKHYVQGVDIVMNTGTADVRILAGTSIQGTGVLAAGNFVQGGGISKNWMPHFQTGTNSELIYHFVGAGTAFITISYWKGV